jgi:cation/acetate symporter
LIIIGPSIMGNDAAHLIKHAPIFPLENPGILSVPLGFIGAFLGTLLGAREPFAEEKFTELEVRANTGLGAEKATAH